MEFAFKVLFLYTTVCVDTMSDKRGNSMLCFVLLQSKDIKIFCPSKWKLNTQPLCLQLDALPEAIPQQS